MAKATKKSTRKSTSNLDNSCCDYGEVTTWKKALQRLEEGNVRYKSGNFKHPNQQPKCRELWQKEQKPWCIVLSCADSRVTPELVFDTGIGELFVIRVAGNIANASTIASIEYAVANLDVELIVVLGHEDCGAIKAALEGEAHTYNLNQLLGHLAPVADEFGAKWKAARSKLKKRTIEYDASEDNARNVAQQLKHQSPEILLPNDKLDIVPAVYQTGSGQVDWERKYAWA